MALSKSSFQSNSRNLISSIRKDLGGEEILGEEKDALNREMLRQEAVKQKIKIWLSWYSGIKNQGSVLEAP